MEKCTTLLDFCMEAATASSESVEKWRRQRRTVERLPSHLADTLFRCLYRRRLLFPSILEVFQLSVEVVDLKNERTVDAEWMAYLGQFCYMRSLNIADCKNINNSALWFLSGVVDSGRENLIKPLSLVALQNLSHLRSLNLEDTRVIYEGFQPLSLLTELESLYLKSDFLIDGLFEALEPLQKLRSLGLQGGALTDHGLLSYKLPPSLRMFDLRGCCLLSANAISSFCKKHRQVEVRHKHANTSSLGYDSASSLTINKLPLSRPRTVKSSVFPLSKPSFVDERIKYSIDELTQLESSPGSSRRPKNFDLPSNIFAKRFSADERIQRQESAGAFVIHKAVGRLSCLDQTCTLLLGQQSYKSYNVGCLLHLLHDC